MKRKELLSSSTYWSTQFQIEIYRAVRDALEKWKKPTHLFITELGISSYKFGQIMNGDWIGTVEEFCRIMVKLKKAPKIIIENLKNQK